MQHIFETKRNKFVINCDELNNSNPHLANRNGQSYNYNKTMRKYFYYLYYLDNNIEGEDIRWE